MKTLALLLLGSTLMGLAAQEPSALKQVQTIPLPGVKGRFDHFSLDTNNSRLVVAALGNDTVELLDTAAGKHLKSITGLHTPQGVLYLPALNQIAAACGSDGTFRLFDGATFNLVKSLGSLPDADNLRFDPKANRVYVGYGEGALGVIDPAGAKQTADIKLAGHPESFQLEQTGNRIFVNVPDAHRVVVIDRSKNAVVATWPMTRFKANFPMALDETRHRLFIGCRKPARLVVLDTETGKPVTDLEISGDTDDLFYDATRQRLYLSCGEGFIDVIDQRNADTYARRERLPTRGGARTSFFSAERDVLYLAVPQRDGKDAEIRAYKPE
jgi:DNA-binding beta-propeller fold protein YncE